MKNKILIFFGIALILSLAFVMKQKTVKAVDSSLTEQYFYDAEGRRIMKALVDSSGKISQEVIYVNQYLEKDNASGVFRKNYFADGKLVAVRTIDIAPITLTASQSGSLISLSWTAYPGANSYTSYIFQHCIGANCSNFTNDVNDFSLQTSASYAKNLVDGNIYRFRVFAHLTSTKNSDYSNVASVSYVYVAPSPSLVPSQAITLTLTPTPAATTLDLKAMFNKYLTRTFNSASAAALMSQIGTGSATISP